MSKFNPISLGTLQQLLVECVSDLRKNKDGLDPLKYPSQILCLAQAIEFTENCEKAIKSATLPNFLNENKIALAITGTANAVSVSEHVMTMMLCLTKNIYESDKLVKLNKFKEKANLPNFLNYIKKKYLF